MNDDYRLEDFDDYSLGDQIRLREVGAMFGKETPKGSGHYVLQDARPVDVQGRSHGREEPGGDG